MLQLLHTYQFTQVQFDDNGIMIWYVLMNKFFFSFLIHFDKPSYSIRQLYFYNLTIENITPVPFASQCSILVPRASRYIVFRQKLAIPFAVLQQNPLVDLSVQKNKAVFVIIFPTKKSKNKTKQNRRHTS